MLKLPHPTFADDGYELRPGVLPKGPLTLTDRPADECQAIFDKFIDENWRKTAREPLNMMPHPYLVPGATYNNMWDWDCYFTACALPDEALPYSVGSCLNLLEAPSNAEGCPSKKASVEGEYEYTQHPYPLRAQFTAQMIRRTGDDTPFRPLWGRMVEACAWFEKATRDDEGFFRWLTQGGIDNDPSIYGQDPGTCAGADLASFHVREYRAMSWLARRWGEKDIYAEKAREVAEMLQKYYYDGRYSFFFNILRPQNPIISRQAITWVTRLPFRNCTGFFPLWAKAASQEQAAALRDVIMDETEFLCDGGVRTHSKADIDIYCNDFSGNPSNWQGPIWGLAAAVTIYGLANYGFVEEAREIGRRIVRLYASDILANGVMHEYYDAETSQPVIKPGFMNWNCLMYHLDYNLEHGLNPMEWE